MYFILKVVCFDKVDLANINTDYFSFDVSSLNASGNSIACLALNTFESYFNIFEINLSVNLLTQIPVDSLNNINSANSANSLNTLVLLDFSYNLISWLNMTLITNNLKYLNLSHNLLTSINDNTFVSVSSLLDLDLSYNQIGMIRKNSFFGLNNLKTLNLDKNFL